MSGVEQRVASLAWPIEWQRTSKRDRKYLARGDEVQVVWVDCDGVAEQGLLLPAKRLRKWEIALVIVFGALFSGLAVLGLVLSIAELEFKGLIGVLCVGLIGVPILILGLHQWRNLDSKSLVGLRITPTRLIYGGINGPSLVVPWNEVARIRPYVQEGAHLLFWAVQSWNVFSIEAHNPDQVLRNLNATIRRLNRLANNSAVLTLRDDQLAVNPLLAYHLVRHYYDNPADRPNIGRPRM